MSFYRRFISYMYDVSDTSKRKNCGFVKVEVRGNKCTILFQLKNAPCQKRCDVYLCHRGADPEYIFLKSIPVKDGTVCCRVNTHSQNMTEQGLSFEQCCGILCIDEEINQCGTCWDNTGTLPKYQRISITTKNNAQTVIENNPEIKAHPETTQALDLTKV